MGCLNEFGERVCVVCTRLGECAVCTGLVGVLFVSFCTSSLIIVFKCKFHSCLEFLPLSIFLSLQVEQKTIFV